VSIQDRTSCPACALRCLPWRHTPPSTRWRPCRSRAPPTCAPRSRLRHTWDAFGVWTKWVVSQQRNGPL